jgi:hypothetical protein
MAVSKESQPPAAKASISEFWIMYGAKARCGEAARTLQGRRLGCFQGCRQPNTRSLTLTSEGWTRKSAGAKAQFFAGALRPD